MGQGTFLTGSAVFFTQIVGLTAAQVGLGLTVAGAVSFVLAVPMGKLADVVGHRQIWAVSSFLSAGLFAVWPFIDGMAGFLAMIVALEAVATAGFTGYGAYTIAVLPRQERVQS